jgi:hypothetical protein
MISEKLGEFPNISLIIIPLAFNLDGRYSMLDKNKRKILLTELENVYHLMKEGLKPEQISIALDMDIGTVNVLMYNLNEIEVIIAPTGKSMDFILDQYGLG